MYTNTLATPYYLVYESAIRHNLDIISDVAQKAGISIIMALKANALWKSFPIVREYICDATASSLNEMKLALKHLGGNVHAYCPAYTDDTIEEYINGCSHITFNTISQYERFESRLRDSDKNISAGLRINPQCSVIETDIYNPCIPGSRFGMERNQMPEKLPDGIEGFHFHALCESSSQDLEVVLKAVEDQFGKYFKDLKWINMGGGHLMTREDYDTEHLIRLLIDFKKRYPNLQIILEPGSAFMWRTGDLIASVVDIVEKNAIKTAIIDASFACHMPDCLEMPYKPTICQALPDDVDSEFQYRIGGNSCLSGDWVGDWRFERPLKVGDIITFKDMNHYTTVKTTMFNGISHPSIWLKRLDGDLMPLRIFDFSDYESRMD